MVEAQREANRLNHAVLVGLPICASQKQRALLYDTGGLRRSFGKWREQYHIAAVVWPSETLK